MLYPYGKKAWDDKLLGMLNRETQINMGFYVPYYGYEFNYTQVYPGGFISFAMPTFMQPPYEFPNPLWPLDRDPSFIAPFFADSTFQYIGNTPISNVWYRVVHRSRFENPTWLDNPTGTNYGSQQRPYQNRENQYRQNSDYNTYSSGGVEYPQSGYVSSGRKKRQLPSGSMVGTVIDDWLLDNITKDIQDGKIIFFNYL